MSLDKKLSLLKKIILDMDSVLIAFSGGVDSTFLLKVSSMVLPPDKILAVTAYSATYPKEELLFSKEVARILGVRHKVIKTYELEDKKFTANPINRCYFCKRELFSKLKVLAKKFKLNFVADASNVSDKNDFRPGSKAKEQLKIRSPLEEAGFNKEEIRALSKKLGLVTWNKPNLACLASRIPYGRKIKSRILARINKAEVFLRQLGFRQVRLRHYNSLCRIEVFKGDIPKLISQHDLIVEKLKRLGYNYITVDLEGYRTGSLNEVIKQ
ncbi:MAG: ATP-dependent sacrificial sulfur transferase LarE [Candidatus Omnitrophota bacterium]|nr:ATP-dependent sacrificial sulfur transferase LarE [Candidatus Omnitrophota bacterium]